MTEEALKRAHENKDNAFEYLDDEGAKAFAKTLTEPEKDNPLWGIPYFAKDNFSTKGIPTTASSNILNGYVPVYDATVVSKLKAAKAVMIGKTTLDELAMGGTGTTGHLGKTYNPYDPKHVRPVFYKVDVTKKKETEAIFKAHPIDAVIHFAGYKAVGESVYKPIEYYQNNLGSALNVLDVMRHYDVHNFIFSSSATVYGVPKRVPLYESDPVGSATNPYGETKIMIKL